MREQQFEQRSQYYIGLISQQYDSQYISYKVVGVVIMRILLPIQDAGGNQYLPLYACRAICHLQLKHICQCHVYRVLLYLKTAGQHAVARATDEKAESKINIQLARLFASAQVTQVGLQENQLSETLRLRQRLQISGVQPSGSMPQRSGGS